MKPIVLDERDVSGSTVIDNYLYEKASASHHLISTTNVPDLDPAATLVLADLSDGGHRLVGTLNDPSKPSGQQDSVVILQPMQYCPADFDKDGEVGFQDLTDLLADWEATCGPHDLNHNGTVDFHDLVILLANWGSCDGSLTPVPPDVLDCLNASSNVSRQLDCLEALIQTTGGGS